jgi:hypothetical protein
MLPDPTCIDPEDEDETAAPAGWELALLLLLALVVEGSFWPPDASAAAVAAEVGDSASGMESEVLLVSRWIGRRRDVAPPPPPPPAPPLERP